MAEGQGLEVWLRSIDTETFMYFLKNLLVANDTKNFALFVVNATFIIDARSSHNFSRSTRCRSFIMWLL